MLLELLRKIESPDDRHRRKAVIDEISALGFTPIIDGYSVGGYRGDNIMVTIPGKIRKKIVLTAHTDTFRGSPGANSNASGCTVLLDLLRKFKNTNPKYALKFIFCDQEVQGAVGSQAYNTKFEIDNVIALYNPKMVGIGDSFIAWDVDDEVRDSIGLNAMRSACKSLKVPLLEVPYFKELQSDYRAFREEGNNSAVAFATVPRAELDLLVQYIRHPVWSYGKYKLGLLRYPTLFKHYKNSLDRSLFVSEQALQLSSKMLETTVQHLCKI